MRNYVEVQRRAIKNEKKFSFFNEDITELLPQQKLIEYPPEIQEIEEEFVDSSTNNNLFGSNDPIHNRIIAFLITRNSLDQDKLIHLTGFSRSTISRYMQTNAKNGFVNLKPKKYQKSQIYFMESASLSYISEILKIDYFIFSWVPKFKEIIKDLQTNSKYTKNKDTTNFLISRINEILDQIEILRVSSNHLEKAQDELLVFLNKK
jgi:DNA-binding transcriptional regulator GbsR (MarR family)